MTNPSRTRDCTALRTVTRDTSQSPRSRARRQGAPAKGAISNLFLQPLPEWRYSGRSLTGSNCRMPPFPHGFSHGFVPPMGFAEHRDGHCKRTPKSMLSEGRYAV